MFPGRMYSCNMERRLSSSLTSSYTSCTGCTFACKIWRHRSRHYNRGLQMFTAEYWVLTGYDTTSIDLLKSLPLPRRQVKSKRTAANPINEAVKRVQTSSEFTSAHTWWRFNIRNSSLFSVGPSNQKINKKLF